MTFEGYKMILIADSGSTKTDWRLIDGKRNIYQFSTIGFNPYFQDTALIAKEIKEHLLPCVRIHFSEKIRYDQLLIYFYGAGCSCPEKSDVVKAAIQQVFPESGIEVEHDLLGAARALCGNDQGIAAILGTGSNSCYYDGGKIVENIASLGFILGDEGSGAYMGKLFMQDYLNNDVPKKIVEKFNETYKLSKETILDAVYKKTMPNKFLASYSKFIYQNQHEQYVIDLVGFSFNQFFNKHICKYSNCQDVKMSCVGSIGYYYSRTLRDIAATKGIVIDKIIESPISALTLYHLNEQPALSKK